MLVDDDNDNDDSNNNIRKIIISRLLLGESEFTVRFPREKLCLFSAVAMVSDDDDDEQK